MKNVTFLGAAAFALMAATAANAQNYVGAVYGNADIDGLGDANFYGVEGAFGGPNYEFDLSFADSDESDSAISGAAHLLSRSDSHLLGAFVGASNGSDSTTWTIGGEGNIYMDNVTFAGAIGYASNDDIDTDGFGLNGEARLFPSDNFRLQAIAGFARVDTAGLEDDVISFGLGGEYQFGDAPFSVALNWDRSELSDADITAETLTVGLRYNFGGTLRDRDRTGASQAGLVGFGF
ncbi:MAG: hypothetical protein ABL883_06655 [Terricaulis sp.]